MSATTSETSPTLLETARAVASQIHACADQIERERQLPESLIDALATAGLFRLTLPRELGGPEIDPETFVRIIEELAQADGSVGWCVMISGAVGTMAGSLTLETAREIWGDDLRAFGAGTGAGQGGPAIVVDGGYWASGRWTFASGCRHATWLMAVCDVLEGGVPRLGPNGVPERRWMLFPAADCRIIETWDVTGLRGTGSHDFAVEGVFVPHDRTVALTYVEPPRHPGPLYAFSAGRSPVATNYNPTTYVVSIGFAAVSLGIARGALDAFVKLAGHKAPRGGRTLLRDHPVVQDQVGRAEASLRAARAFLYETVRETWQSIGQTGALTEAQTALLRLASAHAATRAAEVVEVAWKAAGASAIFAGSPLERRFRDVHVATQNIALSPSLYGATGRVLLGCDVETSGS